MGKFWVIPVIIVLGLAICVLVALRAPSVTTVRLPDIEVRVYSQVQGSVGSPFNEAGKHIWIGSVKDCVLSYFIDICTRAVHGPNKIDSHTRKSIKRLRFIFDGSFRKTKE